MLTMGCLNRQRINYTMAAVQVEGSPDVIEGSFMWRRAGQGATVRVPSTPGAGQPDLVVKLTHATAEPVDDSCTRWKITGAEGVWFVEWVDHSRCKCGARPNPNR